MNKHKHERKYEHKFLALAALVVIGISMLGQFGPSLWYGG